MRYRFVARQERFPPNILRELADAGFVEVRAARSKMSGERVRTTDGVNDFAARIRTIGKFHLLDAGQPSELAKFVEHSFSGGQLNGALTSVLHQAGIGGIFYLGAVLLEIATEPPRLRQNHDLFEKKIERFRACFEPLASWLSMALKWDH